MYFVTADHHFGHKNIIDHCNRPYGSVEEMDEDLIAKWNSKIKETDIAYYLGDFTLNGCDYFEKIFNRLNGCVRFIQGNHDKRWLNGIKWTFDPTCLLRDIFETTIKENNFVLSHYPLREWNGFYRGTYHLHGHTHGNLSNYKNSLDIGVDCWDYYPVSFDEIIKVFNERK